MKTNHMLLLVTTAFSALFLCQCATNRVPELKPGEAYFNASPQAKHRAELTGFSIVSVNGKKAGGRATRVPSGSVKVVVEFNWPKIGKKQVPLSFNARDGHTYFVKYDRYPHPGSSGESLADTTEGLFKAGSQLHVVGLPLIFAGIAVGLVDHTRNLVGAKTKSTKAAQFIDLFVISTLSSEGVVQKVRTYPFRVSSKNHRNGS
jgi:hypothetical protein